MSSFQLFAVGLITGTLLQLAGLILCGLCRRGHCRRLPGAHWIARGSWLCGVSLLLLVAGHDRDATLFAGQMLAAWGFWKISLLDVQ